MEWGPEGGRRNRPGTRHFKENPAEMEINWHDAKTILVRDHSGWRRLEGSFWMAKA